MTFLELLKPNAIKVMAGASSKKRLIHDAAELAASAYGINADMAVEALLERESLGPTGVGQGVALPHARLDGIDSVLGVFIVLEKPVDFESVDRQPVDLIFALFAPEDAGVEHLKALALVSRTLRNKTICTTIRSNHNADTIYTLLTEPASTAAA